MTQQVKVGELSLNIPENYRLMTEDEVSRYYLGQTTGTAWIDEDANAVVRIDQSGREIPSEGLEALLQGYVAQYQRMAPGFVLGEVLINDTDNVGVITFKSNAPTRDLFNILSVIDVAGQEYDVLATCDFDDALASVKYWSEEFLHVLDDEDSQEAEEVAVPADVDAESAKPEALQGELPEAGEEQTS